MTNVFASYATAVRRSILAAALTTLVATAQTTPILTTLYSFTGGISGANPSGNVVFGANGDLFGTTAYGGAAGYGTVYQLTGSGTTWSQSVIHSFGVADGANPAGSLAVGAGGVLYGTTFAGGTTGNGAVFQLSPNIGGGWTESVLYSFLGGLDGSGPQGGVIVGAHGELYGTTVAGGNAAAGTVFQLTPPAGNGTWTESIIYNFQGGKDGSNPQSGLTQSGASLYGTTCCGTEGTVFRLAKTKKGWTKFTIFSFLQTSLGASPYGSVAVDSKGVVFGTASAGGTYGAGVVFSLTPNSGKPYTFTGIHDFTGGTDGGSPYGGMTLASNGDLYLTVSAGGTYGAGAVVSFTPPVSGGSWSETVLHAFTGGSDGGEPFAGVIFGSDGALYGTTPFDGAAGYGTVFRQTL